MGLLRLHFTETDLARTRIAYRPDALWELVLSANLLGNRDGRAVFDAWRTDSRARVRKLPVCHRQLIRLVAPPYSDFPDLLTPPAGEPRIRCPKCCGGRTTRRRAIACCTNCGPARSLPCRPSRATKPPPSDSTPALAEAQAPPTNGCDLCARRRVGRAVVDLDLEGIDGVSDPHPTNRTAAEPGPQQLRAALSSALRVFEERSHGPMGG